MKVLKLWNATIWRRQNFTWHDFWNWTPHLRLSWMPSLVRMCTVRWILLSWLRVIRVNPWLWLPTFKFHSIQHWPQLIKHNCQTYKFFTVQLWGCFLSFLMQAAGIFGPPFLPEISAVINVGQQHPPPSSASNTLTFEQLPSQQPHFLGASPKLDSWGGDWHFYDPIRQAPLSKKSQVEKASADPGCLYFFSWAGFSFTNSSQ